MQKWRKAQYDLEQARKAVGQLQKEIGAKMKVRCRCGQPLCSSGWCTGWQQARRVLRLIWRCCIALAAGARFRERFTGGAGWLRRAVGPPAAE